MSYNDMLESSDEDRNENPMHARKPKDIPQRLERYAQAIIADPCELAGIWKERLYPQATQLHVDLGCGKGAFAATEALAHPDVLYIGIDYEDLCIAFAAQKAVEQSIPNLFFVHGSADDIAAMFATCEIDVLYLNFSTPFPRKKYAANRLTYVDKLVSYRSPLAPDGRIELKTDSQPFFDFSLIQFDLAAYDITWQTRDLHATCPDITLSEYELRLSAKGAKIHALTAVKADRPCSLEQTGELSLMAYLPEDLESLDYVPYGMENAVMNFRNRRRKERARLEKAHGNSR